MKTCRAVRIVVLFLLIAQIFTSLSAQARLTEKDLSPKYGDWLRLVGYIILPQEKEVFLKLSSDFERDIFIEAFWKQRDPTAGTPENEYRDEIRKRFAYVKTEFKKGAAREGWQTDMGRIYMMLGQPVSRESFTTITLYPCELWTYYGDTTKGLPTNFGFIFFRPEGTGDFQLYSPLSDGPARLLINKGEIDLSDNVKVFEMIRDSAPSMAPFVLSYIPNEMTYGLAPSMRSEIVLAEILESPRKNISPSYATHFLRYKGVVSTEYMTNFVDSEGGVAVLEDPFQQARFIHYAIVPKTISVDFYEPKDQYFCTYTVDVSLRRGEELIFQYSKDYSYYFPAADSTAFTANGVCIQDSFPVVEGDFRLTVLLRNSVAKEFSLFEKDVSIERAGQPRIYGPILGYKLEGGGSHTLTAFKLMDQRLHTDPRNTFTSSEVIHLLFGLAALPEDVWKSGRVRLAVRGLQKTPPVTKDYEIRLADEAYRPSLVLHHSWPAADLAPDYFEVRLSLVDGQGRVLDERTSNFIITPSASLPRPVILSKSFPRSSSYLLDYVLSGQYEQVRDLVAAEAYIDKAHRTAPDYPEGIIYSSRFLLRSQRYEQALVRIESIKDLEKYRFQYCLIKGQVLKEMGRYLEAIGVLLEGNRIYNSDTGLLNALAFCFWRTGQKEKGRPALEASLKLNPDQPEAQKLLEEMKK